MTSNILFMRRKCLKRAQHMSLTVFLLEHGIVFADHIKDGELERHRIEKDMICQMNKHSKGEWTSPKGVIWRWDLNELSFWRNDVFFAVRLMTPCGRWI